ncbi:MAG: phosphodiester glycosidase family protein [Bacteroidales bacterium]|jgi:exopolysaccharide biosynthesis protein|nr:phosphodiester glycosidase family protein [Bacteroidales bacterium]
MKRLILVLLLVTGISISLTASNDSILLVSSKWSITDIAPGIVHKQIHFSNGELFGSNQFINIIEVNPSAGRMVEIIPSPILIETSKLASQNEAIAAINGSFFKFNYEHNTVDYNSVDYIRKEGRDLAPNTYERNRRAMHQRGALAIHNNKFYILKADQLKEWERFILADEVITTGPLLRVAGIDETLENSSFYTTRHPRTAMAKREDGTIIFFTVDGRAKESFGMSLKELQNTLRWLGASDIINLDGGGSTTMFINGVGSNGIVNHPTDNRTFDNLGERKVANIVIIK